MSAKSTIPGARWKERMAGEEFAENQHETSGNRLRQTCVSTWDDEFLLKPCASRLEKLAFCNKNSAAAHANVRHLAVHPLRAQKNQARPFHFHTLQNANRLAGIDRAA